MSHAALLRTFAFTACSLCLIVVVLGAYVRLSDAGLGCPDWPGCYGHITPLGAEADVVQQSGRPLELGKAWREMAHRYAAGTLATLIMCLAAMAIAWRRERLVPLALTIALAAIVIVQALFGMLTVTGRLKPLIVTLHLLFGLTTLSLLWWLVLGLVRRPVGGVSTARAPWAARALALIGLLALVLQITLGGWTSSNYAALACPDVPTCQGSWWPRADFAAAYTPSRDLGTDLYTLVAIQLSHRIGALAAGAALLVAAIAALAQRTWAAARPWGLAVLGLVALQLTIGVTMVEQGFPLWLATAHNAGAALLLLATLALNRSLGPS